MVEPLKDEVGTVWIKTEPTNGDTSTYFQIKCEEEINITDTIPYTDSVCFTVQELDPESVNVKQEPLEFRTDDHGTIPSNNKRSDPLQRDKKKPYVCDQCGKAFPWHSSLVRHIASHSGERPFACDECGMRFAQKGHIKPHKRKHSGERPYACDECEMRFAHGDNLKKHKLCHANEAGKLFGCDVCAKAFSRKADLKRHGRMHSGEKPYECDVCGVKFAQNAHLKKHRLIHFRDGITVDSLKVGTDVDNEEMII